MPTVQGNETVISSLFKQFSDEEIVGSFARVWLLLLKALSLGLQMSPVPAFQRNLRSGFE